MSRSIITRMLHAALAVAISHQLIISWFMEPPRPNGSDGNFAFELHETVGLASLALLFLFWCWTLFRNRETEFGKLFPWLSSVRLNGVMEDTESYLKGIRALRVPTSSSGSALASAIHGLGLIIASVMAVTGAIYYFAVAAVGVFLPLSTAALETHAVVANLMWAYLIGHSGMAIVHELLGSPVLKQMFFGRS